MSLALSNSQRYSGQLIDPQRRGLKKVLRRALEDTGVPQKVLAIACGVDPAVVCRWCSDHEPDVPGPLHFPAITRELGPALIEWLNIRCEFDSTEPQEHATSVPELTGLLANRSGQMVQQLIQAWEDGTITPEEKHALKPEIRRLRTTLDAIETSLGGMQ